MRPWESPVSLAALPVPARSGIYFLLRDGEVVYVGQAVCLASRIFQHASRMRVPSAPDDPNDKTIVFDSFATEECPIEMLVELERRYIVELLPEYNTCAIAQTARKPYLTADEYRERPYWGTVATPEQLEREAA